MYAQAPKDVGTVDIFWIFTATLYCIASIKKATFLFDECDVLWRENCDGVPSVYLRLDFLASGSGGGCGRRVPMYRPVRIASSLACDSSTIGSMISKPVFTLFHIPVLRNAFFWKIYTHPLLVTLITLNSTPSWCFFLEIWHPYSHCIT